MSPDLVEFIKKLERVCRKHEWWDGNLSNGAKNAAKREVTDEIQKLIFDEKEK